MAPVAYLVGQQLNLAHLAPRPSVVTSYQRVPAGVGHSIAEFMAVQVDRVVGHGEGYFDPEHLCRSAAR
jgi:hypothetical protein